MKYPNIILFRYSKYQYIDNYLNNKKYECTFNITENPKDLNKLFNSNYHLLITFGDTEKEYHGIILPNIVNRFANRWIHKSIEHILNIEEFNSTINYCYINNVIMERKIQRPEFSVFTTCYNTWDKFDRVYNSLKNQNLKDWEWVIIDDTPLPENGKKNHFDFLREKCKNDFRIRLYCRSENSGNIGNVKNEAVSLCRGKYILELDHDDEILPDCLLDALLVFDKDDEIGFIYMDFINIYENGENFSYGDFICKGYGGYYCQKYKDKWVNVYITPNINNITLSHLACCPNHPRIWRKSTLLRLENYSEFLPICDDYEILLKTALNTKIVKIHKLGYIQYMNNDNNNFSLIRNGEINRIGPGYIFPQFYQMYNVNDKMKELQAYEDENFIFNINHSQIWKRENYKHQYYNKIVNLDYNKQYCLIGEEALEMSELSELYKDKTNSFIILSNTLEIEKLQKLLDIKGYGNMRCYSLLDCSIEELERYFILLCKFCDNYKIINSCNLNNSLMPLPSIRSLNSLLILFGESFRLGEQYTRNVGSDQSYKQQIDAAKTHIKFIESLNEQNINMKVSINSYTTKFDNSLNEIYKSVLLDSKYYENLIGQSKLIHNCIDKITNINDYDFILCMRIDLYLKDKFLQIFNPYCNKILFPSVCFKPHHKSGIHPRVNDMMMFIPKKYFNYINKFELSHNSWYDLIVFNNLTYEDLDMMLNTYHDSDSSKDFNPIYYIVNRNVNNIHKTKEIFDKYNF